MKNRKLKATAVVWITGTIFFGFGMMPSSEWVQFSYALMGIFGVTNGIEHGADAYKNKGKPDQP